MKFRNSVEIKNKMANNRLFGMRCYECGSMDRVPDGGIGWRQQLTPWLQKRGVVVLDPTNKPIDIGVEDIKGRAQREQMLIEGKFDELAKQIKKLRVVDLRMVDMADFLIVYIDSDVHACGTYEELFWANRLKNPVLVMAEGGKQKCPHWLFGVLPHQNIFGNWYTLKLYLNHIDKDDCVDTYNRWMFFDYNKMVPNINN